MNRQAANFARVVIPSPLKNPLVYAVPPALQNQIAVGFRIRIPLGKRRVVGIVLELLAATSLNETRDILAILDDQPILDPPLIQLSQWVAQYYLGTPGEVLTTMLPPELRSESKQTIHARNGSFAIGDVLGEEILDAIRQNRGKISLATLTRKFPDAKMNRALQTLEAMGAIEIREGSPGRRRKAKEADVFIEPQASSSRPRYVLTSEQERAFGTIADRIDQGGFETFLLHGVTGSGKTEVYLRAMEQVRDAGRRSLILIPEIALTPQLIDRLNCRFPGRVGVVHSGLNSAERSAQWWNIARGHVDVVVGARSAVFAPLPDLGLIIVDEEHDSSYKQEEGLRYNGRDVAVVRGKLTGCPVILGSATPAVESYENGLQGRYRILEITKRVYDRRLPEIEIVDLKAKFSRHKIDPVAAAAAPPPGTPQVGERAVRPLVSDRLAEALADNYRKGRQSLIFLNRRGFANFLQCGLCGHVIRCPHCSVTLTFHMKQRRLCCHHCDFRRPIAEACPECGALTLREVGVGTEQIEQSLQRIVVGARIARLDRDTSRKRGFQEALIRSWERGDIDILVGTQMITKGHDVSGVTLVGALLADLSLNLPDFRATERTFQLLNQVAGRSGRGADPGCVIIQTYVPDHYVFQFLLNHDYKGFFKSELEFRRALNYPPFGRLVSLCVDGPKAVDVESKAKKLAEVLREQQHTNPDYREHIEVLGPAPAPIEKLRNRYRWQLLLKSKQIPILLEFASIAREALPRSRVIRLHIAVDPYSML